MPQELNIITRLSQILATLLLATNPVTYGVKSTLRGRRIPNGPPPTPIIPRACTKNHYIYLAERIIIFI